MPSYLTVTAGEKSALSFLIKSNAVVVAKHLEMWSVAI